MTEVLAERRWDIALSDVDIDQMSQDSGDCLGLHRVTRNWSLLSADRRESFCHFTATDAESVRIALKQFSMPRGLVWAVTAQDAPGVAEEDRVGANVLVIREFAAPVTFEWIGRLDAAGAELRRRHGVVLVQSFLSADGRRLVGLYRAADDESARAAFRETGLAFEHAWAFRRFDA